MDRLDAMALLATAVDEGSLAAAGRRHGRSPASVTRAVALLEALTGETLLLRSTRRLRLTPAGDRHLVVWRDVLTRLGETEHATTNGPLNGRIVLTAPELFGRLKVLPVLESFLQQQPLISARILMVNRLVDLVAEGVDLAIRLAPLPDSTLTAIKLGELRVLVCAAPQYLARAGLPTSPQDLTEHDCLGLNVAGDGELWPFRTANVSGSRVRSIRVQTRLSMNNANAAIDAALRGQGLVRARSYQVAAYLAEGRLVQVLSDFETPPEPAHLVFHPDRGKLPSLRAFVDHAVPALRDELQRIRQMVALPFPLQKMSRRANL